MVTPSRSRHILNSCERLQDRYRWRKENIIHYIDSILDHNTFKAFCNLKDRRTTSGECSYSSDNQIKAPITKKYGSVIFVLEAPALE